MSEARYGPVIMIGALIMTLSLAVSAQPTVDDSETYCQSTTWEEGVKQIRADIQRTIKDDLTTIKNLLESRQQHCSDSPSLGECKCKTHSFLSLMLFSAAQDF